MIGAISGFLSVLVGAFAAHGLNQILLPAAIETIKTAVQYQMYHALALILIGVWAGHKPVASGLKAVGLTFILGSFLFCGSLYALALGAPRWLGPITPLGGLCFLIGWFLLAVTAWRARLIT